MIAHLRGRLLWSEPGSCVVECGGVGYQAAVSIPTYAALPGVGGECVLHVYTVVREDALALFGFGEAGEKRLFERLITVAGVGPKLALTILSGMSAGETIGAIRAGDHARLQRIPGVGKRLAERLVVELREKLEDLALGGPVGAVSGAAVGEDVLSALVNLGYNRAAAAKALEGALGKDSALGGRFEELFRAVLGLMR